MPKNIISTFIVDSIFGGSHSGVFLIVGVHIRYTLGNLVKGGGSFPLKLKALCLLF